MLLLLEPSEQFSPRSLFDDRSARLPELHPGDQMPFAVGIVKRVQHPFDSRIFTPQDNDWTIRVAIGAGFMLPVSGNWPVTYGADTSDSIIPANPTQEDVSMPLNLLDSIIAAGGVTVQGADGFFTITFDEVGARTMISGNPSELVPLSILDFQRAVTGDAETQEVQTLRILQNTGALATLSTASAAPAASVALVTQGDGTHNHKVRVTLPADRWSGTWTYTSASVESDPIGYDDDPALIEDILEAVSTIGTGNVSVTRESDDTFLIAYKGTKALQAIAGIAVDGSALLVIGTKSGTLDLRGPAVDFLLPNGVKEAVVSLSVEGTPAGGVPTVIFQRDVLLVRPVIEQASTLPEGADNYYTKAEIDAMTGDSADLAVSTAGTSDLAPAAAFNRWFQKVVAQAGAGAYNRKLTLDTSKAMDGAMFFVYVELAASANLTVEIRNESAAGTLLQTLSGDADSAGYFLFVAEFNGAAWQKIFGGYL